MSTWTQPEWQLTSFKQRFDAIKAQTSFFQTAAGVKAAIRNLLSKLTYADYEFTQQDAWKVLVDIRDNPYDTYDTRSDDHYSRSYVHWRKLSWDEVETAFDELEAEVKKCAGIFESYGLDKYGDEETDLAVKEQAIESTTDKDKDAKVNHSAKLACTPPGSRVKRSCPILDSFGGVILVVTILTAIYILVLTVFDYVAVL